MPTAPKSVKDYLAGLPDDRRKALSAVRKVIRANLDKGYEEGIQYGMIGYYVPHRVYPDGYHCDPKQPVPFASIASQKNHMAVYLMCIYGSQDQESWFRKAWAKTGKKLDMGKSCIRFKKIDDVALDVIGQAIKRVPASKFIASYEAALSGGWHGGGKNTKKAAKKKAPARKKAAAKKKAPARRKAVAKKAPARKKAAAGRARRR